MSLNPFESRASIENPSTPLGSVARWLSGGQDTWSGSPVSPRTALHFSAVWGCVRVLSETLAQVPLGIVRKLEPRGRELATDHWLYPILSEQPNKEQDSFQWRELSMGHLATWGNAYSRIVPTPGKSTEVQFIPLLPDRTRVERRSGKKVIVTRLLNGSEKVYNSQEVLHVAGPGYSGLMGYSVITMARQAIGLGRATEEFGSRWFSGGARPSGFITHPGRVSDEDADRILANHEAMHGGLEQAHRTGVLQNGMGWQAIGIPPEDSQFLQTRKFQIEEIARFYRMPPHMIQELSRATFSNIEQQSLEFVMYTMMPWFVRWEKALGRQLLTPQERSDGLKIKFNVDALLRGDAKSRAESLAIQRSWGTLTANEWRELENRNPLPDDVGDQTIVPLNYVPAGQEPIVIESDDGDDGDGGPDGRGHATMRVSKELLSALDLERKIGDGLFNSEMQRLGQEIENSYLSSGGDEPEPEENALPHGEGWKILPAAELTEDQIRHGQSLAEEARALELRQRRSAEGRRRLQQVWLRMFLASAERIIGRELSFLRRIVTRAFGPNGNGVVQFEKEVDEFFRDFPEFVRKEVAPILGSYTEALREEVVAEIGDLPDDALETWADGYAEGWGRYHVETSRGHLAQIIAENDADAVEEAISERLDNWEDKRADKIALKESVRVAGAYVVAAFASAGITRMVWHTFGKSCPFCQSLDGRTVSITGSFAEPGDKIDPEDSDLDSLEIKHVMNHPPSHGGCDCGVVAG